MNTVDLSPFSPGVTLDELDVYMAPVVAATFHHPSPSQDAPHSANGCHQLPESPPDSGSEPPYSPPHDYMLLQGHEYGVYETLKSDEVHLDDVVVLHDAGLSLPDHAHAQPYQHRYNQMRIEVPEQGMVSQHQQYVETPDAYGGGAGGGKKRKLSQDVKCEPAATSPGSEASEDAPQTIRFANFQPSTWAGLVDINLKSIPKAVYMVTADKGFNYSQVDEAFVCQKKNHFQVTCQMQLGGSAHFVQTAEGLTKIVAFRLHFYGVKAEDPSQEVRIEQSQSDRTKKPFHPVPVELGGGGGGGGGGSKVTVGRLHFAETTHNNMRKKGRPNPDQRHFQLVVALKAHTQHGEYIVAAQASDRIIVRASNPGQFESDCGESWWQRGVSENSVHFTGRVGINTDRPDESCVINGNLKVMGHIVQPSDARAKHDIQELDTQQQLRNVQNIRVVKFNYDPRFAQHSGLVGWDGVAAPQWDAGVIAQEVRSVLPDAVREAGDVTLPNGETIHKFLVVNKDRIFMENIGAVKELCKLTDQLENRLDKLEKVNSKLRHCLQRRGSSVSSESRASSLSGATPPATATLADIARHIKRHECCHKLSHHSPTYTRKQCKSCHLSAQKYHKYYHTNKTSASYDKHQKLIPIYSDTESVQKAEEDSALKKKEGCLLLSNDDSFVTGNSVPLCCKRDRLVDAAAGELISNKFLQIVITVLIFIMAVCLVVMSALYFREHQQLLSMKEISLQHDVHRAPYPHYGKPLHRATPADLNQIQTLKPSLQTSKKTAKEKLAPPPPPPPPTSTGAPTTSTGAPATFPATLLPPPEPMSKLKFPVLGLPRLAVTRASRPAPPPAPCPPAPPADNELDVSCQSLCNLELPQTFENQELLERNLETDSPPNDTFRRPELLEPNVPIITERNNTDKIKNDNESLKDDVMPESINSLDRDRVLDKLNQTYKENLTSRKRRSVRGVWFGYVGLESDNGRVKKRETNEAILRSSSEEMTWKESSDEVRSPAECDTMTLGVAAVNASWTETACGRGIHLYRFSLGVARCLSLTRLDLTLSSSALVHARLCCSAVSGVPCAVPGASGAPLSPHVGGWRTTLPLSCSTDRTLEFRASYQPIKDLCSLTEEDNIPFVAFNIRVFRDCRN